MPNESTTRTAVVVGATGIIGRALAAKLAGLGGWRVLGVTRSGGTVPGVDEAIAVDLRDPEEARRRLAPAAGATHLFFAAYLPQASWAAEVGPNRALLVNAVEGLEAVGAPLRHVTLITGAKYYGVHGFTAFGAEAGEVMAVAQVAILAGRPYTALRDAILTHPTMAEGLAALFSSVPRG